MDAVQKANSGHPGAPMALAPLAYMLYTRVMKHSPRNPDWFDRDRFVLSRRARVDAALLDALPDRLRAHARRPEELPPARQPDRRATRSTSDAAGHRGHHRPARPGHLDVGRDRAGRADARRPLQPRRPRDRRPPHLHDRERRRHAGGRRLRGVLAGRPPRPRQADRLLRQQPHPARRARPTMSFSEDVGKRYEAYGWHVQDLGEDIALETARARPTAQAKDVEDRPSLDHRAHPHRLRLARTSRTPTKAHGSPLGEDEVEADQGGLRLADPTSRSTCPTRRSRTSEEAAERGARGRGGVGPARRPPTEAKHPDSAERARR